MTKKAAPDNAGSLIDQCRRRLSSGEPALGRSWRKPDDDHRRGASSSHSGPGPSRPTRLQATDALRKPSETPAAVRPSQYHVPCGLIRWLAVRGQPRQYHLMK